MRNDNNDAPLDCLGEDIEKRVVVIDKPYADITRTWILTPQLPENNNVL